MNKTGGGNRFPLGNYNLDGCPMGDSVGVYSSSGSTNNSSSQYDSVNHPPIRETGIIEKLLVGAIVYLMVNVLFLMYK